VSKSFELASEFPAVVFVNPSAGAGRAGAFLSEVREIFGEQRVPAEFLITESVQHLESLVRGAIADGRRLFFALGGDGTFQALVNASFGSDVLLGLLPAGGGNDFALALGLPRDRSEAARSVLRGQPRCVDVLRARTSAGFERLYLGGGGIGVDVDAVRYAAEKYRRWPGRWRYVAGLLRALRGFAALPARAEFPGSGEITMEEAVLLAAVFNGPSYGGGLRVAPNAVLDDGQLDIAFVKDLSASQVLKALVQLLRNGTLPEAYVKRGRGRSVVLSADRPCMFHGDGEIFGPTPVQIEVVPRAIRVLAPPVLATST
jgi:diacylglycerol kinase (ATP)